MSAVSIATAETEEDILAIKTLQTANLRHNIPVEIQNSDGFLSNTYDLTFLRKANQLAPSIVAKDAHSQIIGYALTILPEVGREVPELAELISLLDTIDYQGKPVCMYKYYVMGQVCIADGFRGQKIFDRIYAKHRELYANSYELLVTEVADKNQRSLRAHHRVGFKTVHTLKNETTNETWHVIVWDWRQ